MKKYSSFRDDAFYMIISVKQEQKTVIDKI